MKKSMTFLSIAFSIEWWLHKIDGLQVLLFFPMYTSIKKKSVQVVSTILARLLSFNCCYLETCNKTRDDS
jgi:hypothetical protein